MVSWPSDVSRGYWTMTTTKSRSERLERWIGRWLRWVTIGAILLALPAMIVAVWPIKPPGPGRLSLLEAIFYSRAIIIASRVLLLVAALYIAASVFGLIAQNRWLSELGPFKASNEPIDALDRSADSISSLLTEEMAVSKALEQQVAQLKDSLDAVSRERDEAVAELENRGGRV